VQRFVQIVGNVQRDAHAGGDSTFRALLATATGDRQSDLILVSTFASDAFYAADISKKSRPKGRLL
jgi:hypothetical protein